jgi:hypothetical protein
VPGFEGMDSRLSDAFEAPRPTLVVFVLLVLPRMHFDTWIELAVGRSVKKMT